MVLLNYIEARGQQKRFFMSPSCFTLKNKDIFPGNIYFRDYKKQLFSFEIIILYLSL